MGNPVTPSVPIGVPETFRFSQTVLQPEAHPAKDGPSESSGTDAKSPPLGVLKKFDDHTFCGFGFNTIFRPHSTKSPTVLEVTPGPTLINDNILQLNLTRETMRFDPGLGTVPNRGLLEQEDINLNGVPYTQTIFDVTVELPDGQDPPVIHHEPGLWMRVPESTTPALKPSLARMASIPHGTTINAQCFEAPATFEGPPKIEPTSITPFSIATKKLIPFPSQIATDNKTFRLPQDLTPFTQAETITQEMITNPNVVLKNANKGKEIIEHTTYTVSTVPPESKLGGGTSNIGFLVGDGSQEVTNANRANANAVKVTATYWVSTVRAQLHLEPFEPTSRKPTTTFSPIALRPTDAVPVFTVNFEIPEAKTVTVEYTQIQYSQTVFLDFATLSWPHTTVATLAPIDLRLDACILHE